MSSISFLEQVYSVFPRKLKPLKMSPCLSTNSHEWCQICFTAVLPRHAYSLVHPTIPWGSEPSVLFTEMLLISPLGNLDVRCEGRYTLPQQASVRVL